MDGTGRIIGQIYDAALDPGGWPDTLASLQTHFGAIAAGIYTIERRPARPSSMVLLGVDDGYRSRYVERFLEGNPWSECPVLQAPGRVRTERSLDEHLNSPGYYERTALYNEWMKPQGFIHTLGTNLSDTRDQRTKFFVYRPRRAGVFTSRDVMRFGTISQHLSHANSVAQRLALQDARYAQVMDVIDHLRFGVAFLDGRSRVTYANRQARLLLDRRDGICLRDGKIAALYREDGRRLHRLVHQACGFYHDVDAPVLQRVAVRRIGAGRPLCIMALPLSRAVTGAFASDTDTLALLITDPEREPAIPQEWLRRHYGLTAAESRITRCLVQGNSLRGCAEVLGVTYETARSYLKLAMQKTGTKRQSDLVRKMLSEQVFVDCD